MILKSKLGTNYPQADPAKYLIGGWWKELDPIFAGRLANASMMTRCKIDSKSAYRSTTEQQRLYKLFLRGGLKSAAKPGTSWHEFRLAVDTSTQPIRAMSDSQLRGFGLCKPIPSEGWHIQPIETLGKSNKPAFQPVNLSSLIKAKFGLADATISYMESYEYALPLFEKLLSGEKLADSTIDFLKAYKYGNELIKKLGI